MADIILFQNKWVTVIDRDGYTLVHGAGNAVAVLPFRGGQSTTADQEFLARIEPCPPHGPKPHLCALTGGIEGREEPVDAAVRETFEESGFRVTREQMIRLGIVWPSKLSTTIMHLFAVDVSAAPWEPPPGDGTTYEAQSSTVWLPYEKASMVPDASYCSIILRLGCFFREGLWG